VAQIVEALELAYERGRRVEPSADAVEFAKDYEADRVYAEHWRPAMKTLARWEP
jgi:hypothetical protein